MPPGRFDAVLLTSARACSPSPGLAALTRLPVYAVGAATAAAARAAGFADVRAGDGGAQALLDRFAADAAGRGTGEGGLRLLWVAGAERSAIAPPPGVEVAIVESYAAVPVALADDAVAAVAHGEVDVALVYSARAARLLAASLDDAGLARGRLALAAISAAALAAVPGGWAWTASADVPNEAALLRAAGLA